MIGLLYLAAIAQIGSSRGSSHWMKVPSEFLATCPSALDTFIPSAPALNARSISAANFSDQSGSLMPSLLNVMNVATRSVYGSPAFSAASSVAPVPPFRLTIAPMPIEFSSVMKLGYAAASVSSRAWTWKSIAGNLARVMFVRGRRSSVSGIGGTSGPLVTQPAGGATDSIVGRGGIQTSPSLTPAGALGSSGASELGGLPAHPCAALLPSRDWPAPE